jgi:DNA modification methylase
MTINKKIDELVITSKSHPQHYMLHKYWGRKPHDLVQEYIKLFTKPGDTVLDPFMGSGGVVIESNKMNRIGIGVDLNPMACLIVSETLKNGVDYIKLEQEFNKIVESIPEDVKNLAYTKDKKGRLHLIDNAIWEHGKLTRLKYYDEGGRTTKDAEEFDMKTANRAKQLLAKYEDSGSITFPRDEIMKYVKRSGKNNINELFTERNLLFAAFFMTGINKISDKSIRESLTLIFTSALPNFSSMIPGDVVTVNGKSGWQISKFWVPKVHSEKNALNTLKLRLTKYINGKKEMDNLSTDTQYKVLNQSSENLKNISPKSVDYVFTDPPYGDSISYFALSSFWSAWVHDTVDYGNEIIYDPYRNKREDDYSARLDKAFKQVHRVLKDNGYMSFTFHNRHIKFWKIVIDAVYKAGFELINVKWVDQAVSSGTQGINRKNTLKGDFVYTFKKLDKSLYEHKIVNGEKIIDNTIKKLLKTNSHITTTKLYESLIPEIINDQAYYDSSGKLLDIDKYIAKEYEYKLQKDGFYGWSV